VVTVLTARALAPEEIKVESARQVLAASAAPETRQSPEARLKAQERARAQLRVARHAIDQEGLG
jgi:citrate lyase beta subunit